MIRVGQTYERSTGVVYTVVDVKEAWFAYGEGGVWRNKLVPRVKLMAVVPSERAGEVIHETVPTGNLEHYKYVRLA